MTLKKHLPYIRALTWLVVRRMSGLAVALPSFNLFGVHTFPPLHITV